MDRFDISIIGGGVIGLAVARALGQHRRFAHKSIVILEQEASFGQHISSRNSEVVHAGIYYPSGSLKARFCVRGKELLYDFCKRQEVPFKRCGKLIVAGSGESAALEALQQKALANGVEDLAPLSRSDIHKLEPDIESELALFSPSSGIVDSHEFMAALLRESEAAGAVFARQTRVVAISRDQGEYRIRARIGGAGTSEDYSFNTGAVVNCAGLYSADVLRLLAIEEATGQAESALPEIHFCKGDYFSYTGPARFRHLVYPLPEANTTGLGIHATLDLGGQIRFGPDTDYVEHIDYDVDPAKKQKFITAIRRYLPDIKAEQLHPAYSGIRPKLTKAGEAAADFLLRSGTGEDAGRVLHLLGIESPGLTSSLALAEHVADRLLID